MGKLKTRKTRNIIDLMDELEVKQVDGGKWAVMYFEDVIAVCVSEQIATFVQMAILTANINPLEVK